MQPPLPAFVATWRNDTYDAISPSRPALSQKGKTIVITGAVSISYPHSSCTLLVARPSPSAYNILPPLLPEHFHPHHFLNSALLLTKANDSCLAGQWHWSRDSLGLRFCWCSSCCASGSIRVSARRDLFHRFRLLPPDQNVDPCSGYRGRSCSSKGSCQYRYMECAHSLCRPCFGAIHHCLGQF